MKRQISIILGIISLLLTSCGEDRSGEFYALIEDRIWIEETMSEHYLWYQDMPQIENENEYFQTPENFFKKLLSKEAINGQSDKYSYMEKTNSAETRSIMLDRSSTYGIEFILTTDPTGTTNHTYARVLYTLPGSPAETAGIQRGDWISAINDQRITNDNYTLLMKGGSLSLTVNYMAENEKTWQKTETVSLPSSINMEINPFFVDTLYNIDEKKIAYLMYNDFSTGPNNEASENVYLEQMKQIFKRFKTQSPNALILDLRYNSGGYLQCVQMLGSLIAPTSALGKNFLTLTFNDKTIPQTIHYALDSQYADANLNLDKVYILTSHLTASASEALINGLVPYMGSENVVLIGTKTEGKNIAMEAYSNDTYGLTLWPAVAYVSNADGESNYSQGFTPQYNLNEFNINPWYPLGDTREFLLKNTLSLITQGVLPYNVKAYELDTEMLTSSIIPKNIPIH